MSGLVHRPQGNRKPNWSKWRLIPEVKVWQGVALSLDLDPDLVRRNPNGWMGAETAFSEGREFKDRFDIVSANVGPRHTMIPVTYLGGHMGGNPVKLREFAAWCISIDWSIPNELRALALPPTRTGTPGQPSIADASAAVETLSPAAGLTATASSERPHDPSLNGAGASTTGAAADAYFRQLNAHQAAKEPKFANEAGYAQLVAEIDAKDLQLNLAPDWRHWANMAYVTVSDAACLSLGISPEAHLPKIDLSAVRKRTLETNKASTRVPLGVAVLERAQRTIQQRVEQAMSAIATGQLPSYGPRNISQVLGLESLPSSVRLSRYRRWAESLPEPYIFPAGFPPAELQREPMVHSSAQTGTPPTDGEKPLREPERGNWLAIIHALAVMAELPERGAASSVERQLQQLGYDKPKERTIRDVLNEARKTKD